MFFLEEQQTLQTDLKTMLVIHKGGESRYKVDLKIHLNGSICLITAIILAVFRQNLAIALQRPLLTLSMLGALTRSSINK